MALIKCSECGKEISDKASCCPNCGCPIEEILKSTQKANSTSNNKENDRYNKFESTDNHSSNNIDLLLLSKIHKKYPDYPTYAAEEYASIKKISKAEAKRIVMDYYKTTPPSKFKGDSRPKKNKGILKTLLSIVCAFFIFIMVVGSCSSSEESSSSTISNSVEKTQENNDGEKGREIIEEASKNEEVGKTEDIILISPGDLLDAYEANEIKADSLYEDKMLCVTGKVASIGKDILDDVYITFNGHDEYSLFSVQCYFSDDSEINKVMDLLEGDTITIIGTCNGSFGNVTLKDCIIE